jgi:hypothetical protein
VTLSKETIEERLDTLEGENVETTNELYRLAIIIDFLDIRIKKLEDLVIGDNK